MTTEERSRTSLRLPTDVRDWLVRQARHHGGSQNSEIVRLLRERMEAATEGRFGDTTSAAAGNTGGLASAGNAHHG